MINVFVFNGSCVFESVSAAVQLQFTFEEAFDGSINDNPIRATAMVSGKRRSDRKRSMTT